MALTGSMKKALKSDVERITGGLSDLETKVTTSIAAAINNLRQQWGDMCLTPAGLQIGTTSKKEVRINATTTTYLIDGVFKSKSAAEVAFTATTHDIAANASTVQERCYTYSLNAAGTCTVTAGAIATGSGNAVVAAPPTGECMIGYLRLAVAAGATPFDATSDDLDAAHLTDTYVDTSGYY